MEKFKLNPDSNVPLIHQAARMIRSRIVRKELNPGDFLPSVRELGQELGVNFNTVAKAYRQLEKEDLIEIRHGLGARIKDAYEKSQDLKVNSEAMLKDLDDVICKLSLSGADKEQVVDFFAEALGQHFSTGELESAN